MNEMYIRIEELCKQRGVNVTQMCRDAEVPRGNLTDLKNGRTAALSTKNLGKISSYFGVTLDYLLGTEKTPTQKDERGTDKENLKFALWGTSDIDDELLDEVQRFAEFAKERRYGKTD